MAVHGVVTLNDKVSCLSASYMQPDITREG